MTTSSESVRQYSGYQALTMLVSLGLLPLFTRRVGSEGLGEYAVYSALVTLGALGATLRLESRLFIAEPSQRPYLILLASFFAVILPLPLFFLGHSPLALAITSAALQSIGFALLNQKNQNPRIAAIRFLQTCLTGGIQLALLLPGIASIVRPMSANLGFTANPLITADCVVRAVIGVGFIFQIAQTVTEDLPTGAGSKLHLQQLIQCSRSTSGLHHSLTSSILMVLGFNFTTLVTSWLYGSSAAHFLALAQRLHQVPISLFAQAYAKDFQTFIGGLGGERRNSEVSAKIIKNLEAFRPLSLATIGATLISPVFLSLLLGKAWAIVGYELILWLPWTLLSLVLSPYSSLTLYLGEARGEAQFHLWLFGLRVTVPILVSLLFDRSFLVYSATFGLLNAALWTKFFYAVFRRLSEPQLIEAIGDSFRTLLLSALCLCTLTLLIPLYFLIAGAIFALDGGPLFFTQTRAGYRGRPFTILKFKTMKLGPDQATRTRLGTFLKRTGLDELPQLVHIVRGEMSLVGPRPLDLAHVERLSREKALFEQRSEVRPGLLSLAQAFSGLGSNTYARVEAYYSVKATPLLDLTIVLVSGMAVVLPVQWVRRIYLGALPTLRAALQDASSIPQRLPAPPFQAAMARGHAALISLSHTCNVQRREAHGVSGFLKTRKRTTSFLVPFGNLFLKLAGTHQRLLYRSEAWAEREVLALTALYGEEVRTDRPSRRALWISDFGARSVRDHLRLTSRRMNPQELARAAAVELRRFHDLQQEGRPYFFIHGDPHAGNILYCERRKRAFLIDFETMAVPTSALLGRCPKATHSETTESMRAEDLAIFILDILRELDPMDWMPVTRAFLDAYGVEEAVHVKLFKHLAPEGGKSSLFRSALWHLRVRTGSKGSYLLFIAKLRSISSHGRNQEALKHFERVCDPVSYFHK